MAKMNLIFVLLNVVLCYAFEESNQIKPKISSINGNCVESKECWIGTDDNRVCVERKCRCKPNYHFDYINNRCQYFTCRLDKDCQTYDRNRRCDLYDGCRCGGDWIQNPVSLKCIARPAMGSMCAEDSDCWTREDSHRVCLERSCVCKLFYKYDSYSRQCLAKNVCDSDKDCHKYDKNRICDSYGLCVCDVGFAALSMAHKCHKISKNEAKNEENN